MKINTPKITHQSQQNQQMQKQQQINKHLKTEAEIIQQINECKRRLTIYQALEQEMEELNKTLQTQYLNHESGNDKKTSNVNKKIKIYQLKKKLNRLISQQNTKEQIRSKQFNELHHLNKLIEEIKHNITQQKLKNKELTIELQEIEPILNKKIEQLNNIKTAFDKMSNYQSLLLIDRDKLQNQLKDIKYLIANHNCNNQIKDLSFPQEQQQLIKAHFLNQQLQNIMKQQKIQVQKRFTSQNQWRLLTTTQKHKHTSYQIYKTQIQTYQSKINDLMSLFQESCSVSENTSQELVQLVGIRGQLRGAVGIKIEEVQTISRINCALEKDKKILFINTQLLKQWQKINLNL